jgi:iron(III) transport system substrate-binding protein
MHVQQQTFRENIMKGCIAIAVRAGAALAFGGLFVVASFAADQATIDAAKKEGEFVHTDNYFAPESVERFHKAFRAKYRLPDSFKIRHNTFNSSAVVSRIDQEIKADHVTTDWMMVNTPTYWLELKRRGDLLEYCSPEYKALTLKKKANFLDGGCFFQPAAGIPFPIVWNPKYIKEDIDSWAKAADPKYTGQVVTGDPRKSDAYLDVYIAIKSVMGMDWFKKLAAQKPFFLGRSTDMRDRALSGEYPLWYPGIGQRAYQVRDQAVLKVAYPKEGVLIHGLYAGILKKAPHPNAAKLWTDFLFSKEGQELATEVEASLSARVDVTIPDPVKPYLRPLSEIKAIPMDWEHLDEATRDKAREQFRTLFGG